MTRPSKIDGIQPHQLELPQKNQVRSSSEDSLETEHDINANNDNETMKEDIRNSDEDAGLSDEGLGDITSEASNSPQPPATKANNNVEEAFNHLHESKRLVQCDNNLEASEVTGKANNNYSLPTSPSDERVPSRIPFPKKQHKSQTNL